MKALFIWHKNSHQFIQQILSHSSQFDDVHFIYTEEEYEKYLSNEFIKGTNSSVDKKKQEFIKIYISVELGWGNPSVYEGYKIGYDLIEKINGKEYCLHFFSFQNRKTIYEKIPDKYKFLVKALPFTDILELERNYRYPIDNMSLDKLSFFKTYAFLDYGIIDNFIHRLEAVKVSQSNFQETIKKYLSELSSYKEFIGKNVFDHINNTDNYTSLQILQLIQLLRDRVLELTDDRPSQLKDFGSQYKIMVIEDNHEDLNIIRNSLKRYYDTEAFSKNTKFFISGEEALETLKEHGNDFDFVISDLELLDEEGFYQKVQGVDIYNYVINRLNKTVVGLITGYGRKGVVRLLDIDQNHILSKQHLRRFNENEELDNLLKFLLEEYQRRENKIFYDVGPLLGIASISGYRITLSRLIEADKEKYYKEVWRKAMILASMYAKGDLYKETIGWSQDLKSPKSSIKDLEDFIEKKHAVLLAHRLIVLYYYVKNNQIFDEDGFKESVTQFMDLDDYSKGYLTTRLGFNRKLNFRKNTTEVNNHGEIVIGKYRGADYKTIHKILFTSLFPEERDWIELHGGQEIVQSLLLIDNTKYVVKWLEYNFKEFFPNENFEEYTFGDLWEFLDNKLKNNKSIDHLEEIIENRPIEIDYELNEKEKRYVEKLLEIYSLSDT
jgi:CheY-like chemotaxis protein/disulfide oxidoreductase YuzD